MSLFELLSKQSRGSRGIVGWSAVSRFFDVRRFAAVLLLSVSASLAPILQAEDTVTLNFKDADLNVVIETVAEITGKNFVIDPRVKGKVTVVSSSPMDAKAVYDVFLAILDVHGFAAVPDGKTIQIIPSANAKQGAVPTYLDSRPPPANDVITRIITVDHVPAAQLVPILRPLVPQQGHMAAYQPTNTLIISDRAENIARLEKIIRSIDQPSGSEIEVIRLKQASAAEVVRILGSLQKAGGAKDQGPDAPTFVADERTNSILLGGDRSERLRLRAIISHLDTPIESGEGNTHVVYLRYAKATELVKVLTGIKEAEKKGQPKAQQAAAAVQAGGIDIQADEGTNSLVITAAPDQFRSLQAVISKLDIRRAQVMVEAIIAEISGDMTREFGVQWLVNGASGSAGTTDPTPIAGTNFSTGTSISGFASGIAAGTPSLDTGLSLVVGRIGGTGTDFAGLVRALASDSNANVLSTPTLVTLDNEEAEIVVGENRPFVTGSYTSTGTGTSNVSNPFQTIQRQDVGLKLKIQPQINEGSAIKLDIEQEVSSVIPGTTGDSNGPSTTTRNIKTSVLVDDGKILVLGGLVDDQITETEQRVPLLGDIPILGWLFRYHKTEKIKRNLMVFLKPVILRENSYSTMVTSDKYNYMRLQQMEARSSMRSLMSSKNSPLIKDFDTFLMLPPPFEESGLEEAKPVDSKP